MRTLFALALGLAIAALPACGGDAAPEGAPEGAIEQSLSGGCRVVCPKCHQGEVCPLIACVEDCSPAKQPCIDTVFCPLNYSWSTHACSCVPDKK
jgi:hypothetical protein